MKCKNCNREIVASIYYRHNYKHMSYPHYWCDLSASDSNVAMLAPKAEMVISLLNELRALPEDTLQPGIEL